MFSVIIYLLDMPHVIISVTSDKTAPKGVHNFKKGNKNYA